jgi:[ribosomal protein S5]-alanine N-acetyltransferase
MLRGSGTFIRPLELSDAAAMLEVRARNDEFLRPFEPLKPDDYLTLGAQRQEIERSAQDWRADRGYAFGIFSTNGSELIGRLALSNVARGAWQNATLGYFVDEAHNGRGHGTEAVGLVLEFAFIYANLHRVQAAVMLRNEPSARVLQKNGFRFEGTSKSYLRINGVWEDHHVYALTLEDWEGGEGPPDE